MEVELKRVQRYRMDRTTEGYRTERNKGKMERRTRDKEKKKAMMGEGEE